MQTKLNSFEYKFGFDFSRKSFPHCLAKAPLDDERYLVLDYYQPRNAKKGWYVASRRYDNSRVIDRIKFVQSEKNKSITFNQAKELLC